MRIAFIADPPSSFKIYKDSTYAMMVEAAKRGHELHFMLQEGLMWKDGRILGDSRRLTLTAKKDPWYEAAASKETPLAEFDAVLMRKDPPFDAEYVASTWLLELAQKEGARIFNDPRAIRDHSEKLAIAKYARFAAPTLVTRLAAQLQRFIDANRDVVLKPLDGMGGESVFRVAQNDPNRNVIIETLVRDGAKSVMAQRYIPEIRDGDKRILLIAGNFMEPSSIVLLLAPILFPVAVKLGVDPIHFGIIMTINMEVGLIHPPVGLNLYVASGIAKMGLTETTVAFAPWIVIMVLYLLLVTYVPPIATWLPNSIYKVAG